MRQNPVRRSLLSLYRSPEEFDIGLTLGDDKLLMAAYDDAGRLRALIES